MVPLARLFGAVCVVAACAPSPAGAPLAPEPQPEPAPRPAVRVPDVDPDTDPGRSGSAPRLLRIQWTQVETTSGCFYFSGPGELGRDVQLGGVARLTAQGLQRHLDFEGAVFEGRQSGTHIELKRVSAGDFSGSWKITESIVGTYRDGRLEATYAYAECDEADSDPCPGRCKLEAVLVGEPRER